MWKNKHVVVAMLVAPVLAIMAWFAIDYFIGERPHAARPDASYPLLARSNCRYASGACDLENGEFELSLKPAAISGGRLTLDLESNFPLRLATLGVADAPGGKAEPVRLDSDDPQRQSWSGTVTAPPRTGAVIQLVVVANESQYYAEVPTIFLTAGEAGGVTR